MTSTVRSSLRIQQCIASSLTSFSYCTCKTREMAFKVHKRTVWTNNKAFKYRMKENPNCERCDPMETMKQLAPTRCLCMQTLLITYKESIRWQHNARPQHWCSGSSTKSKTVSPVREIGSVFPAKIYIVAIGLQKPFADMERWKYLHDLILTWDGDDNRYCFVGSKYLEYNSSIRIMNNNWTIIVQYC
jgi:hypothetical protein